MHIYCAWLHTNAQKCTLIHMVKIKGFEMEKSLLTIQDVMKVLKISRRTVYYWIDHGILSPIRIGSVYRFEPGAIEALSSGPEQSEPRKAHILAIDDDFLVRESLKVILEREGIGVTLASGGEEALRLAEQNEFDLIVTDVRMPGMNGIETLKAIRGVREKAGKKAIPEIVMTAFEDTNARNESVEMGVKEFIQKPFELKPFLDILRKNIPNDER